MPIAHGLAATGQGGQYRMRVEFRLAFHEVSEVNQALRQGRLGACRQGPHNRRGGGGFNGLRCRQRHGAGRVRWLRRLFHDHVGIRAADTKGAHTSPPRGLFSRPRRGLPHHRERRVAKVDVGVGALEVQRAWNELLVQGQCGLDQANDARTGDQVTQMTLDRPNAAELLVGGVLRPGLAQCCDLNRVTQGRARAVCFDIANAAGVHPCVVQCHANGLRLTRHTGGGETGLVAPIVVDAHAFDDAVDGVAIGLGIGQALEHHHAAAAGKQGAGGLGVERAAMPVGGLHAAFHVQIAGFLWHDHGHAARQCDIALAAGQAMPRLGNSHQRGRAGGVDAERGAFEVQTIRHTGGDIVFLATQHDAELAQLLDEFRVLLPHGWRVGVVRHPRIHPEAIVAL